MSHWNARALLGLTGSLIARALAWRSAAFGSRFCRGRGTERPSSSKAVRNEDGKYLDAKGVPTYKIGPDGKVDWYTFSGFRRFNGTCDVCHGPDGSGSSFGPDLTQAPKSIETRLRASRVPTSHTRRSDPEAIVSEPRSPYCLRPGQATSHESACSHFPSAGS